MGKKWLLLVPDLLMGVPRPENRSARAIRRPE